MTDTHAQIYSDFIERIGVSESTFSQSHGAMSELDFRGFCNYMFQSWTPSQPTFKLTNIGFVIVSRMYQFWRFDIKNQPPNLFSIPRIQVHIFRNLRCPYHHDREWFYVFDSQKAMELEMAGGDLKLWTEMFT